MTGCSSVKVREAQPPAPPAPPTYIQVSHPLGMDTADLRSLFLEPDAPSAETIRYCDADYNKLRALTIVDEERAQGARELVLQDPVRYHWCFYGKLLELETFVKSDAYVDERQKAVLDAFAFAVPIARAFVTEFQDTRYLRWAVAYYRRVSEWVFYRKLELSPQGTVELVDVNTPFGLYRDPAPARPVLDKYKIGKSAVTTTPATAAPEPVAATVPATAPATVPTTAPAASAQPERKTASDVESAKPAASAE